jgi:proteic killer suppression protein
LPPRIKVRGRLSLENALLESEGPHKAASMNDQADTLIRINRQWRVCFRWTPDGSEAVEIADYH